MNNRAQYTTHKRNKIRWIFIGIIGFLCILALALLNKPKAIENDLLKQSRQALQPFPIENLNLLANGREITLQGTVSAETQQQDVLAATSNIIGIVKITDQLVITQSPENVKSVKLEQITLISEINTPVIPSLPKLEPKLQFIRNEDILTISGRLNSQQELSSTLEDLSASLIIQDQIRSSENVAKVDWLESLNPVLTTLPLINNAKLDISKDLMLLSGNVSSQVVLNNIKLRIDEIDNKIIQVDIDLSVTKEKINRDNFSPLEEANITLEQNADKLVVTGIMPNTESVERIRSELLKYYKLEEIEEQLEISDDVSNPEWLNEITGLIPGLRTLENAHVSIKDGLLILKGSATNKETLEEQNQASAAAAKFLQIKNEIIILSKTPENEARLLREDLNKVSLEDILYESNSADFTDKSLPVIEELAIIIKKYPDLPIIIAGHTDATGDEQWNQRLSQLRADAVKDYLVGQGIAGDRLSSIGYGESRPITSNSSKQGRALNRRIEINY